MLWFGNGVPTTGLHVLERYLHVCICLGGTFAWVWGVPTLYAGA